MKIFMNYSNIKKFKQIYYYLSLLVLYANRIFYNFFVIVKLLTSKTSLPKLPPNSLFTFFIVCLYYTDIIVFTIRSRYTIKQIIVMLPQVLKILFE